MVSPTGATLPFVPLASPFLKTMISFFWLASIIATSRKGEPCWNGHYLVRSFLRTRLDNFLVPSATISTSFASRQHMPISTIVRAWQDEQPMIALTFLLFDLWKSSVLRSMKGRRFWLVDALLCMRFADGSLFGDGAVKIFTTPKIL